jgi:hypothetical protein
MPAAPEKQQKKMCHQPVWCLIFALVELVQVSAASIAKILLKVDAKIRDEKLAWPLNLHHMPRP